ncbi:MAG: undecaprenyl-diphosphate phosphatase [Candidatus Omnitrophota bacterium]|nr:undecaprenyl-diphosphate phosphatase [Candidatus Omnitrophota bacterium]
MQFLFFGIIQGLTEFLPISSSGHLYLFQKILGINGNLLPFFVILHLATLLAIILFFHNQLKELFCNKKILLHIGIITLISASLGLIIKHFFTGFFVFKYLIAFCFFINGIILLSAKNRSCKRTLQALSFKDSIILGILQGLAIFPGISRSGITIIGLLKRGFDAKEAFSFSFIMAIPIILGAFLVEGKEILSVNIGTTNIIISFIVAVLSGLFALKIIKKALIKVKFHNFGYYCLLTFFITLFL